MRQLLNSVLLPLSFIFVCLAEVPSHDVNAALYSRNKSIDILPLAVYTLSNVKQLHHNI